MRERVLDQVCCNRMDHGEKVRTAPAGPRGQGARVPLNLPASRLGDDTRTAQARLQPTTAHHPHL